ncbi:MAG: hypothetical protein JO257_11610 [Deltaproteobacteria bacterium]|nr:hypothetical protein [Deltaproteobacteria bacterium]
MSKLLFASLALVAACTADAPPSTGADIHVAPVEGVASINVAPTLRAGYWYRPESCAGNLVAFYPVLSYSDGTPTANVVCQYRFPDGTTVDGCGVTHSIPTLGPVVMTARDTVTGATASYSEDVVGPASFSASINVTTAGDMLSWDAHTLLGSAVDVASGIAITIDPAANVIVNDPAILHSLSGTVHVTADGTYTVTVHASFNYGDEAFCGADASGSIAVDCSGTGSGSGSGSGSGTGNVSN